MFLKLHRIFLLAALLLPISFFQANAESFPPKPKNDFVVDDAKIMEDSTIKEVNDISNRLLQDSQIPIIVVTIESLAKYDASGLTVEKYAQNLFDHWGIGSIDKNYGILLFISKNDRKARIEFGAGWDHRYDNEAGKIMSDLIIPEFKKEQYSSGILSAVRALDSLARGLGLPKQKLSAQGIIIMLIALVLVVAGIYSLFKNGKSGWAWIVIVAIFGFIMFILLRSGRSGGRFGRGSSGGGGSSGSW